jgi:hypothetical protein
MFLIKAGTVKELTHFEKTVNQEVYRAALRIVTMLDEVYGAGRGVDNSDGGFVLIAENIQEVSIINERYVRLDDNRHEAVDVVKCKSGTYINALFLRNNEFGINVFLPMKIAPEALLRSLPQ